MGGPAQPPGGGHVPAWRFRDVASTLAVRLQGLLRIGCRLQRAPPKPAGAASKAGTGTLLRPMDVVPEHPGPAAAHFRR